MTFIKSCRSGHLIAAALLVGVLMPLASEGRTVDLSVVDDWAYQLQGYGSDLREIIASSFDLVVIDYSRDGEQGGAFRPHEIEALKTGGPCGERLVVAYLSIGEAEAYRYYFDPEWIDDSGNPVLGVAPPWLGPPNPDFPDNNAVRFWMKAWQRIVLGGDGFLDRILDAGFDGVYLDLIDAFEFWGPRENGGVDENRQSAREMITFVRRIARHARRKRGKSDFLVIPQNGSGLIAPWSYPDATHSEQAARRQRRRYFRVIDGIGAEDTFFFGDRDENNRYHPQTDTLRLLDQFREQGKTVMAIDYLTRPGRVDRFFREARGHDFVPYTSVRALDRLTIPTGHPPDCW